MENLGQPSVAPAAASSAVQSIAGRFFQATTRDSTAFYDVASSKRQYTIYRGRFVHQVVARGVQLTSAYPRPEPRRKPPPAAIASVGIPSVTNGSRRYYVESARGGAGADLTATVPHLFRIVLPMLPNRQPRPLTKNR